MDGEDAEWYYYVYESDNVLDSIYSGRVNTGVYPYTREIELSAGIYYLLVRDTSYTDYHEEYTFSLSN